MNEQDSTGININVTRFVTSLHAIVHLHHPYQLCRHHLLQLIVVQQYLTLLYNVTLLTINL